MNYVDFVLRRMREELRVMEARLVARIEGCGDGLVRRMANSEQRAARFDINFDDGPVFDSYSDDLGGGPMFDSYPDDLGGGPIFDEDPFVDPVGDAAHDSDNIAVTVLTFAQLACAVHDQRTDDIDDGPVYDTDPDECDDGLVFDTEPIPDRVAVTVLDQGPGNLSAVLAGVVFDEDPTHDEAERVIGQDLVIGADVAPPATIVDTPITCSMKFLHLAVNTGMMLVPTSLQECVGIKEARVLDPNCRVINKSCSTMANSADSAQGNHGGLLFTDLGLLTHAHDVVSPTLVENQPVLSYSIDNVGFEHRFWDPGAPEDSRFIEFADFNPTHYPELSIDEFEYKLWDPGLAEGSMIIELTASASDFHSAKCSWLPIVSLTQRKCGGPWLSLLEMYQLVVPGRALDWYKFASDQLQSDGSVASVVKVDSTAAGQLGERVALEVLWAIFIVYNVCMMPADFANALDYHILDCAQWQSVASLISVVQVDGSAACQIEVICANSLNIEDMSHLLDFGRQKNGLGSVEQALSQLLTGMYSLEGQVGMMLVAVTTSIANWNSPCLVDSHEVVLQGILSVMPWVLVVPRQCCFLMTKAAVQGSPYSAVAITIANKLSGNFLLFNSLLGHKVTGVQSVNHSEYISATWNIHGLVLLSIQSAHLGDNFLQVY